MVNLQRRLWWLGPLILVGLVPLLILLGHFGATRVMMAGTQHPVIVIILSALIAAAIAVRCRPILEARRIGYWLGAVPQDASTGERQAIRVLASPCALALLLLLLVLAGRMPWLQAMELIGYWALGCGIGLLGGRLVPSSARASAPGSWYAVMRRVRGSVVRPSLMPLGYWVVARNRVWARPKVTSRRAMIILLLLPLDIPGAVAIAVTAGVLMAVNMITMLFAVVRIAFAASWWLAPTTVSYQRFILGLAQLAFWKELAMGALLVGAAGAIEGSSVLRPALLLVGSWLIVFITMVVAASAYAFKSERIAASKLHRWLS